MHRSRASGMEERQTDEQTDGSQCCLMPLLQSRSIKKKTAKLKRNQKLRYLETHLMKMAYDADTAECDNSGLHVDAGRTLLRGSHVGNSERQDVPGVDIAVSALA